MQHQNLSVLFTQRPEKYGYRGDYYFWEYLEHYFQEHPEFSKKEDIINIIQQRFKQLSGVDLTADAMPCVQELSHGGMSSGFLSGAFWLNVAIPLLLERYGKLTETIMKTEKSCGTIVFTRENGSLQYVIIQSKEGIYGFPKGHVEGSETEQETALRETLEETGLSADILDGFRAEDSYPFSRNGNPIMKHVVYFLAEFQNQQPKAQESELNSVHLMDYETAMNAFQFENPKSILRKAHSFLSAR